LPSHFAKRYTIRQMPLRPQQVIDHYEILAAIGSGGMGEVYRARDTRLNREVAIKVLPGLFSTDAERLRRFEQEARAAAALNHPNILVVYQLGIHEGAPFLVSELLEGETLRERLKRGPLPVRKVIELGAQIARGLAAAHEKGIVHRDLKPENLFLTKDGHIKILDFGLARLMQLKQLEFTKPAHEAQTVAGMLLGTVGYMSPEQVRGEPADHRSDIFAFTAVLHEMLVGKRTFFKQTSVETMSAILNDEPPSIALLAPNTPSALQRVLQRGLEKNPEQRFQSASDLGFALEALSDSAPSSLTASYPVDRERPARSRMALVVIAIAGLVALVAFAFFWMRPVSTPQVSNYAQLTHDGLQKTLIGTDGSRLFLTVVHSTVEDAAAVQVTGGDPTRIEMPGPGMVPVDVSAGWRISARRGRTWISAHRTFVEPAGVRKFSATTWGLDRPEWHVVARRKESGVRKGNGRLSCEARRHRGSQTCHAEEFCFGYGLVAGRKESADRNNRDYAERNEPGSWVNKPSGTSPRTGRIRIVCLPAGRADRMNVAGNGPPMGSISYFNREGRFGRSLMRAGCSVQAPNRCNSHPAPCPCTPRCRAKMERSCLWWGGPIAES
jgi:serine/threonine protein kinase